MSMIKKHSIALSLFTVLALSGCGGKSSNGSGNNDTSLGTPTPSATGKAVDGYIRGATVCLDLNQNQNCEENAEPTAITNSNGDYNLTVSDAHKAHPNFAKAMLLMVGGIDTDTGAEFIGTLQAPYADGSVHITPITTLLAEMMKAGMSQEEAKTRLAKILELSEEDLTKDPIAEAKGGKKDLMTKALQIQKTIELLAGNDEAEISKHYHAFAKSAKENNETDFESLLEETNATQEQRGGAIALIHNINNMQDSDKTLPEQQLIIDYLTERFLQSGEVFEDNAFETITLDVETMQIVNLLRAHGIHIDIETAESIATKGEFNSTTTIAQIKEAIKDEARFAWIVSKIDEVNSNDEATKVAKETIATILNDESNATVKEAKEMVNQLRETVYTFAGEDAMSGDLNGSTIMGKQAEAIEKNIKPQVEKFTQTLETSFKKVEAMAEAFGKDVEKDFDDVFMAIEEKIKAKNEKKTTSTPNLTISGDDYNLTITDLNLTQTHTQLTATGKMNGKNNARAELTSFKLDTSHSVEGKVSSFAFAMEGKITAGDRTLYGNAVLGSSEVADTINGSFSGKADEPVIEANLTAKADTALINAVMENENSSFYGDNQQFVVGTDNKAYLIIGQELGEVQSELNTTTGTQRSSHQHTFKLHDKTSIDCNATFEQNYVTGKEVHKQACTKDGELINIYDNETISLVAYDKNNAPMGYVFDIKKQPYSYDNDEITPEYYVYFENYNKKPLSEIAYFKIAQEANINMLSRLTFKGSLIDGNVKITAEASTFVDSVAQKETYAIKDMMITDGTHKLSAGKLILSFPSYGYFTTSLDSNPLKYEEIYALYGNDVTFENINTEMLSGSLVIKDASAHLVDTNGQALDAEMNLTLNSGYASGASLNFSGYYHYLDTTFVGKAKLDIASEARAPQEKEVTYYECSEESFTDNSTPTEQFLTTWDSRDYGYKSSYDNTDTDGYKRTCTPHTTTVTLPQQTLVGSAWVRGEVNAGGFMPFVLDLQARTNGTYAWASLYFSRDDAYKMAMQADANLENKTATLKMGDINGVKMSLHYNNEEDKSVDMNLTDKKGNSLGHINDKTGEITYKDGTSESFN